MNRKNGSSLFYAVVLIVIAFLIVVTVFVLSEKREYSFIVLPDAYADQTAKPDAAGSDQNSFVRVTVNNVLSVVETLHRPTSYRQSYVTSYGDEEQTTKTVTVLSNGRILRADTVSSIGESTVLTDGSVAWTWHSDDLNPVKVTLNGSISADDLIGIPTYESLLSVDPATLTDAEYIALRESPIQCIYVAAQENDMVMEYWIGIESGLLFQANASADGQQIYTTYQEDLEVLAPEDEIFSSSFVLPDGSDPFSAE